MLEVPVVYFCYNRPAMVEQSIVKIPEDCKLYIFQDGPKDSTDAVACQEVRKVISKYRRNAKVFSNNKNVGCASNVTFGVSQVLSRHPYAIILEDDLLPSKPFFEFCSELLLTFKYDLGVLCINGFQPVPGLSDKCYYKMKITLPWGWATWSRAWKPFDLTKPVTVSHWPAGTEVLVPILNRLQQVTVKHDWPEAWLFHVLSKQGQVIVPGVNLVQNIGFDKAPPVSVISELLDTLGDDPLPKLQASENYKVADLVQGRCEELNKRFMGIMGPGWSTKVLR